MSRTPNIAVRCLVQGTKCAVVGVLAFIATSTAGTVQTEDVTSGQDIAATAPHQGRIETLMSRYQCSHTGFGPDIIPGSAIVLRDNLVSHVSFDDGWAAYTGAASGTLIAVCRVTI